MKDTLEGRNASLAQIFKDMGTTRRNFYRRKRRELRVAKKAMWTALSAAAFLPTDARDAVEAAQAAVQKAYDMTNVESLMARGEW